MKKNLFDRPLAVGDNGVGKCRFNLYRHILGRIAKCVEDENPYPVEALALEETFISDRLASQLVYFCANNEKKLDLLKFCGKIEKARKEKILDKDLLDRIDNWRKKRNKAIHGLVDIDIGNLDESTWEKRFEIAKEAAKEGHKLALEIRTAVDKMKRRAKQASKDNC